MNRNDGVDLLRGFCILSVILLHCAIHMPLSHQFLPTALNNIIFRSGYYGVIIFFVISGFLITSTCLRRWGNLNSVHVIAFYRMRFARIAPCLFLLLIILSVLNLLHINGFMIYTTLLSQAIISALTFHINYLEAKTGYLPANWDVLWSLSIEEMFYLFFPIACLLFQNRFHFVLLMLAFILIAPFSSTLTHNEIWSSKSYFSCMDGIAVGCLCAIISNDFKFNNKKLSVILYSGLSLFSFIFFFRHFSYEMGVTKIGLNNTLLEIGVGMILIVLQQRNRPGYFWTAPLRWFGRNSYEIYLTHAFIVITFSLTVFNKQQSDFHIIVLYLITIILSGLVGKGVATCFSEPMNRWIRSRKFDFKKHITSAAANSGN